MITSSVARFARTATNPSPLQSACVVTAALSQQLSIHTRKLHQRRNSSSKASIPPNGSPRSRSTAPSAQTATSPSGRVRGRKPKAPVVESGFAHLPSVPSTQHLLPEDINVSSFFSLHRPISVTNAVPAATTLASFAQIFDSKFPLLKHEPLEVMKTLGAAVEDLEGSHQDGYVEEAGMLTQADHRIQHRAGEPRDIPLSRLAEFRPFMAPPVPEALSELTPKRAKRGSKKESQTRSWTTSITVTENITPTGQRVYTATSLEPMVENMVEEPESGVSIHVPVQQPFLQRMRIRQRKWEEAKRRKMYAISVKRQRKLKMKKHKYKKLMKRTRNERRRLGKL